MRRMEENTWNEVQSAFVQFTVCHSIRFYTVPSMGMRTMHVSTPSCFSFSGYACWHILMKACDFWNFASHADLYIVFQNHSVVFGQDSGHITLGAFLSPVTGLSLCKCFPLSSWNI